MLRTYETKPQISVQVGEYPAVCKNFTCDYSYIEAVGEITKFEYRQSIKQLTITGTSLPKDAKEIQHVEFAQSHCTVSKLSETELVCTLDHDPVCGEYVPTIKTVKGNLKNSDSLEKLKLACEITVVTPDKDLNPLGGDRLTFSGSLLPRDVHQSTIEIKFDEKTTCKPQTSSSGSLICQTAAFDKSVQPESEIKPTITINGQTVDNSKLSLKMGKSPGQVESITPSSANPVLKTKVTIKLDDSFPVALDRKDFSVSAVSKEDTTYVRLMNVIKVDEATKSFECMFGGAKSGVFDIVIRHSKYGLLDTSKLVFNVESKVTSYTPQKGSIYGGTLLTITGTNFGKEFTDNPVQISTLGGVGSVDCFLESIKSTEIKCRLDTT